MRAWLFLLSGLLVWTAHFFGVYITASLFPGTSLAKWITAALTLVALIALGVLSTRALPLSRRGGLSSWMGTLALAAVALSAVAVLYQGLPALF